MFAPIIVLGYRRPEHLRRALESLSSNVESKYSKVYIFVDGPRDFSEIEMNNATIMVAKEDYGFGETEYFFSPVNLGLAKSVIRAVTMVISRHGKVIVVEDDLIVSNNFLKYMNEGLDFYQANRCIGAIQGFQYPIDTGGIDCKFLRGADCWGWATWNDRWTELNLNSKMLLTSIVASNLAKKFNLYGAFNYTGLLEAQDRGEIDSWAILWHASLFLRNLYSVFPPTSLVVNAGLDGSGTHEGISKIFDTKLSEGNSWKFLSEIPADNIFEKKLVVYFMRQRMKATFASIFKNLKISG